MAVAPGALALLLHAHLPFVRHPEHGEFLEERWLFEAITECYLPLLGMLDRLAADGIPHRLALSLTPPLLNMLTDELLLGRYARHLAAMIAFAESEVERTAGEPVLHRLALANRVLLRRSRRDLLERHRGNLVASFRAHADAGRIEIVASAATHGYLPVLHGSPRAVEAQVAVGIAEHRRLLGRAPEGFWLPECGFEPGIDEVLARHGIRWFVVESHGLLQGAPRPMRATFAPVVTPAGVAAFGRDAESATRVWSAAEGYPGHPDYRDFHRDIGFDLDAEYVRPLLAPTGERVATGFKYHRVTGPGDAKDLYDPDRAAAAVAAHAADFADRCARQLAAAAAAAGSEVLVVAPYDAELFGHWWFEGPAWLEHTIRLVAARPDLELVTPGAWLDRHPFAQESLPAASSWGEGGYGSVWLSPENDWIYPRLDGAARRMVDLAERFPDARGLLRRGLDQAARELLLAQSSDWAFILSRRTVAGYATTRLRSHLDRFDRLHGEIVAGEIDEEGLREIEARDSIFPAIDHRIWCPDR